MPDLITHSISALPFAASVKRRLPVMFVMIGASFPDMISRSIMILFPDHYPLYWFAQAFHTPIVIILTGYSVSMLFAQNERKRIFVALMIGSLIHLGLDMLQRHYVGGYFWLFPFSYQSFEIPLFWSEELIGFWLSIFNRS